MVYSKEYADQWKNNSHHAISHISKPNFKPNGYFTSNNYIFLTQQLYSLFLSEPNNYIPKLPCIIFYFKNLYKKYKNSPLLSITSIFIHHNSLPTFHPFLTMNYSQISSSALSSNRTDDYYH